MLYNTQLLLGIALLDISSFFDGDFPIIVLNGECLIQFRHYVDTFLVSDKNYWFLVNTEQDYFL